MKFSWEKHKWFVIGGLVFLYLYLGGHLTSFGLASPINTAAAPTMQVVDPSSPNYNG